MGSKEWFCLALRVFGIWLLIQSIQDFVPHLVFSFSSFGGNDSILYRLYLVVWFALRAAFGVVLLMFAPAISCRFYCQEDEDEKGTPASSDIEHSQKALKVGIQLLAVYAMILGIQDLSSVIISIMSGEQIPVWLPFSPEESAYLDSFLKLGINFAFAIFLIIWNERIIAFVEKIRYDPERDAYERSHE